MRVRVPSSAPELHTEKEPEMSGKKVEMQKLRQERERLVRQIEALQNELKGLDRAIALLDGQDPSAIPTKARNVKDTVLGLIAAAGPKGLTVNQVLEDAKSKNVLLDRGTVSSLLSRLKRENTLDMTDGCYFVRPRTPPVEAAAPHQTH